MHLMFEQKFVSAEFGGGLSASGDVPPLVCDRDEAQSWETFVEVPLSGNRIAIRCANGQYVCAEDGGGGGVSTNRDIIGPWESFTKYITPSGAYYVTVNGINTLRVRTDLPRPIVDATGAWTGSPFRLTDALPRLRVAGSFFESVDGEPVTIVEASDFALYERHLRGDHVAPIVDQRVSTGFNMLRVFGMYDGTLGHFVPREYGRRYFDELAPFCAQMVGRGARIEFTVFADAAVAMPLYADQMAHWRRLIAALPDDALVEAVNEADIARNRVAALADLPRPTRQLASHGSNGSERLPVRPWWDYETFHTNGAFEWWRKVGHNAMECSEGADGVEPSRMPVIANENTRAPDNFNNPRMAYDAARGGALLCAGSCFHSVHGKSSEFWDDVELALATEWAKGARAVPLTCRRGGYRHRADLEGPDDLRVYQRGTDDACLVPIHRF